MNKLMYDREFHITEHCVPGQTVVGWIKNLDNGGLEVGVPTDVPLCIRLEIGSS